MIMMRKVDLYDLDIQIYTWKAYWASEEWQSTVKQPTPCLQAI